MPVPYLPIVPIQPPGDPGRLGDKVEKTLQRVGTLIFNALRDPIVAVLAAGVELFLDVMERVLAPRIAPMIDSLLAEADLPSDVRTFLGHIKTPTSQADAIGAMSFASGAAGGLGGAMLGPVFRRINQRIDSVMQTAIPDISTALAMLWRNPAEGVWLRDAMLGDGWGTKNQELWKSILEPRLGVADLLTHQLRTGRDIREVDSELARRGYSAATRDRLHKLAKFAPGPADLISMAVREAWRDDVAAKWGYDADFPAVFATEMEKLGDKDRWAQKYWRAHWQLPGLNTALEALHRLPDFTLDTLDEFLRVSDIPEGWRDVILRLSYQPYTRVDTRRMFKAGVLDSDAVYANYLELGYDEEHALNMAAFTVADALEENRATTKADIMGGFREGMLTADETRGLLEDIGYDSDDAAFLVAQQEAKLARALTNDRISIVKNNYVNFYIESSEARSELTALALSSSEIDVKMTAWGVERRKRTKHVTRGDLTRFFKQGQMSLAEFQGRLRRLGFQDDPVEWYTRSALYEQEEATRIDEERAREEQERIELRAISTEYQRNKAAVDLDMAEIRAAIVDQQVGIQARTRRFNRELVVILEVLTVAEIQEEARADVVQLEADIQAFREVRILLQAKAEELQTQIAGSRLAQTEYLAGISTRLPEVTKEIDTLQASQAKLNEDIDSLETQIAAIVLQEAEYKETVRAKLAAATTDEAAAKIEEEAEKKVIEFERQRRALEVKIEEAQDKIATADVKLQELANVGRPDDKKLIEFQRERRAMQLAIEQAQDDIADAATEMTTAQGAIAERQALLVEQVELIERLQTEEALRAEYEAAITTMLETLAALRSSLTRLQETKAQLALDYREDLIQ